MPMTKVRSAMIRVVKFIQGFFLLKIENVKRTGVDQGRTQEGVLGIAIDEEDNWGQLANPPLGTFSSHVFETSWKEFCRKTFSQRKRKWISASNWANLCIFVLNL